MKLWGSVESGNSEVASQPVSRMYYQNPVDGTVCVGGGGRLNYVEPGSLLFGSFPLTSGDQIKGWETRGMDHTSPAPCDATSFTLLLSLR